MSGLSGPPRRGRRPTPSEDDPQPELPHPRVGRRTNHPGSRTAEGAAWGCEIRMVERVEHFTPELHERRLGEVEIDAAIRPEDTAADIAEGERLGKLEGGGSR
mgnify:CR=1 FL=1